MEGSLPRGCEQRNETRREHAGDQGHQSMGKPADWRPAACRHNQVHLYGLAVLSCRFTFVALRPYRTGPVDQLEGNVIMTRNLLISFVLLALGVSQMAAQGRGGRGSQQQP